MVHNLDQIVDSTQGLTPLVDEFTKSMYPPLDPDLMQKAALDLSRELSEVVDSVKRNSQGDISWLDTCLNRIKTCQMVGFCSEPRPLHSSAYTAKICNTEI